MKPSICLAAGALALFCGCSKETGRTANTSQAAATPAAPPGWTYSVEKDEMRGASTKAAELTSINAPNLQAPYQSGVPIQLWLQKQDGDKEGTHVSLVLTSGQFDCSTYDGGRNCSITVKADNEPTQEIRGIEEDCGEAKCLNLFGDFNAVHPHTPLSIIQKSERLTIEAPLYQFGEFQYQFKTAGLKWEKEREIER